MFFRMSSELRKVNFREDLPSPSERAERPQMTTIQRCERLCEELGVPLPFDRDTASAGEVSDALLRLAGQYFRADPEPPGTRMPERDRALLPPYTMTRMADRMGIEYDVYTNRGELSDRISEKLREQWMERRARRGA